MPANSVGRPTGTPYDVPPRTWRSPASAGLAAPDACIDCASSLPAVSPVPSCPAPLDSSSMHSTGAALAHPRDCAPMNVKAGCSTGLPCGKL
jgi:hypothetical protein